MKTLSTSKVAPVPSLAAFALGLALVGAAPACGADTPSTDGVLLGAEEEPGALSSSRKEEYDECICYETATATQGTAYVLVCINHGWFGHFTGEYWSASGDHGTVSGGAAVGEVHGKYESDQGGGSGTFDTKDGQGSYTTSTGGGGVMSSVDAKLCEGLRP